MIRLKSYAKINWYLRVGQRRKDGFHEIETIFQEIDLTDELTFEPLEAPVCEIHGMPFELPPEQNLIWRAWQLLRREVGNNVGGIRIAVQKRIPAAGGLGGASSNAATTLRALNTMFSLKLRVEELEGLGAKLGSDVAFFIRGGCAVGRGRGEVLQQIQGVPAYPLVLVFPDAKVPTAEAYQRLTGLPRPRPLAHLEAVLAALRAGDPVALAPLLHNDFQILVEKELWFTEAASLLRNLGCLNFLLSGSGSTVFGLKNTLEHAFSSRRSNNSVMPSWSLEVWTRPETPV
jgi:4-diphosphocytidyl-2-C-methyl-D-erythritol kinase